jgi:hypothetical protein
LPRKTGSGLSSQTSSEEMRMSIPTIWMSLLLYWASSPVGAAQPEPMPIRNLNGLTAVILEGSIADTDRVAKALGAQLVSRKGPIDYDFEQRFVTTRPEDSGVRELLFTKGSLPDDVTLVLYFDPRYCVRVSDLTAMLRTESKPWRLPRTAHGSPFDTVEAGQHIAVRSTSGVPVGIIAPVTAQGCMGQLSIHSSVKQ